MSKPIVIYHANCIDGFCSAWCFWKKYQDDMEYFPGFYNQSPPEIACRDVYLTDFSYKREVMQEIVKFANSVILLDHHKSALEDLWDLKGLYMESSHLEKSGAILAWEYLNPKKEPYKILKHVQDRDLWQFKIPYTKEIIAYLAIFEYDFKIWDKLIIANKLKMNQMIKYGEILLKKNDKDIREILKSNQREITLAEYIVPLVNISHTMASDAGHIMAENNPFAVTYTDGPNRRYFSLRSRSNGVDVSKIALQFGGGGHKHAAGFSVLREHSLAKI